MAGRDVCMLHIVTHRNLKLSDNSKYRMNLSIPDEKIQGPQHKVKTTF